ncbi:MAG: bifunctional diaminohydroxyphosphoribosylaminopyrimidine deaminase/5-amino-6-(5-phosphoribosylamino)uracil reductase RibD, partial [Actinomycetota bacterium]|nr:bifunctional diaminohydroxyphosphoribosylaminopyrimidine deaminase/5-amino-6-(5-phosphoribosylamino)uracil reductase RibD [Actinomycetota bacterium]
GVDDPENSNVIHMRRAVALASLHRPHPNPRVGAVVVDSSGAVVGEGAHEGVGRPHAEVVALEQAGDRARNSTLYVTLEPCVHYGNTPPCVTAIGSAGITKVVVGAIDPDPRVSGRGVAWLQDARIEVVSGVLADEVLAVDPAYFHHRLTGLPRVTLKWAMTLDGSIAALDGSSRWVSSEEARADAHLLRANVDAIVVGAGTVRSDDPELTVRLVESVERQPKAVIVAGAGDLPEAARIWSRDPLVISTRPREVPAGELVVVDGEEERPDPIETASVLADRGLLDVLLEGGSALAGAWWRAGVVSRGVLYLAAKMGGGRGIGPLGGEFSSLAGAREVNIREVRNVGSDLRIEFE